MYINEIYAKKKNSFNSNEIIKEPLKKEGKNPLN